MPIASSVVNTRVATTILGHGQPRIAKQRMDQNGIVLSNPPKKNNRMLYRSPQKKIEKELITILVGVYIFKKHA